MSEQIMLSQEERDRFAAWLDQDADSTEGIVREMEKLSPLMERLIKMKRTEVLAQRIVAKMLRSIESVNLQ